eukprot:gene28498-31654_t
MTGATSTWPEVQHLPKYLTGRTIPQPAPARPQPNPPPCHGDFLLQATLKLKDRPSLKLREFLLQATPEPSLKRPGGATATAPASKPLPLHPIAPHLYTPICALPTGEFLLQATPEPSLKRRGGGTATASASNPQPLLLSCTRLLLSMQTAFRDGPEMGGSRGVQESGGVQGGPGIPLPAPCWSLLVSAMRLMALSLDSTHLADVVGQLSSLCGARGVGGGVCVGGVGGGPGSGGDEQSAMRADDRVSDRAAQSLVSVLDCTAMVRVLSPHTSAVGACSRMLTQLYATATPCEREETLLRASTLALSQSGLQGLVESGEVAGASLF